MNIYDFVKNFDSFLNECRANKLSRIRIERDNFNFNFKKLFPNKIESTTNANISFIKIWLVKKLTNNNLVVEFNFVRQFNWEFEVYAYLVNDINKNQEEYIEIPQEFLDEIKRSKVFIDTLKERISSNIKKYQKYTDDALNKFIKNITDDFQKYIVATINNRRYQNQQNRIKKAKKAENKKQIEEFAKNYAKENNIKQKWYIQSDIYRGEYAPATDDDYNGHLDNASFEMVASELCTTKDEVIKLSKAKVGTAITKIDEERRLKSTYVRKQ